MFASSNDTWPHEQIEKARAESHSGWGRRDRRRRQHLMGRKFCRSDQPSWVQTSAMETIAQPTDSGLPDRSVSKHSHLYASWSAKTGSSHGGGRERTDHGLLCFCRACATRPGFPDQYAELPAGGNPGVLLDAITLLMQRTLCSEQNGVEQRPHGGGEYDQFIHTFFAPSSSG